MTWKRYDLGGWVDINNMKRWDGTQWVEAEGRRWNGSTWEVFTFKLKDCTVTMTSSPVGVYVVVGLNGNPADTEIRIESQRVFQSEVQPLVLDMDWTVYEYDSMGVSPGVHLAINRTETPSYMIRVRWRVKGQEGFTEQYFGNYW
ncbi:hypothetical protein J9303_00555 [Bacillaceae bacterium Marseille-Q3522]|nr:hypothetical protein [Bacillaceae bacterium Marseille-Q3522]